MGTRNQWGRLGFAAALLLMAGGGGLLGQLIVVRSAAACECTPPTYEVSLREMSSSDPAAANRAGWAQRGTLTASRGSVSIDTHSTEPGGVFRMEATP